MISKLWENKGDVDWWMNTAMPYGKKKIQKEYTRLYFDWTSTKSRSDLLSEDWDNLIWIDACRYDLFKDVADDTDLVEEELEERYAKDIPTFNFLYENFKGEDLKDTVYITSHPMYTKHDLGESFHAVIDVWDDSWDDELYTVTPESMMEATLEAFTRYPKKRIITHFMQPHYPFIGPTALEELPTQMGFKPIYEEENNREWQSYQEKKKTIWKRLEDGEVDKSIVWECYRENLEITLPYIKHIIEKSEGKTVITSDHGNMLGERSWPYPFAIYGHPSIHVPELLKVPWLVVDSEERKDITYDNATDENTHNEKIVQDRLEDLGYLNI